MGTWTGVETHTAETRRTRQSLHTHDSHTHTHTQKLKYIQRKVTFMEPESTTAEKKKHNYSDICMANAGGSLIDGRRGAGLSYFNIWGKFQQTQTDEVHPDSQ